MTRATNAHRLSAPPRPAAAPVLLSLALLVAAAPAASAVPYTITPLVQGTADRQLSGAASLNDDGSFFFGAATPLPTPPGELPRSRNGVYLSRNGVVTPVFESDTIGSILRLTSNARGDVAFYGQSGNDQGYYKVPAGATSPTLVAAGGPGRPYSTLHLFPSNLLLGDDGRVLFHAVLPDGSAGIFDGPDPAANRVLPATTPVGTPNLQFVRPDGTVLFRGVTTTATGIYKGTDARRDRVMDVSRYNNPGGYAENRSGSAAAFTAFTPRPGGGNLVSGIFTGPDPLANRLVDDTGPFAEFDSIPEVAGDGTVVFSALLDDGRRGVFTGPDAADKVIAAGDSLFGSTVTFARTNIAEGSHGGVNDAGQVLFYYTLANGQQGLALGSPVPEPTGLLLGGLAAIPLARRTRRRPAPERAC